MDEFAELADYSGLTTPQLTDLIMKKVGETRHRYPTLPTGEEALKRCAVDLLSLVFLMTELIQRDQQMYASVVEKMQDIVALMQGNDGEYQTPVLA